MNLAILETGAPPGDLAGRFGRYPAMFARILGPGFDATAFDVQRGELPSSPDAFGGVLVTGSRAGVNDGLPWIELLLAFLREARGRTRLVGVCFGHQAMAAAFGGRVERSPRGWGLGLHAYDVVEPAPWLGGLRSLTIPASHQDQVAEPPPGARTLARSPFAPYAALAYGEDAVSVQGHPEFEGPFAQALLLAGGHRERLGPDAFEAAHASLDRPHDGPVLGAALARFLRG